MPLITEDVLNNLKNKERITISGLQRVHSLGFYKAHDLFYKLVLNGFITPGGDILKAKVQKELGETPKEEMKIIFLDVDGVLNCSSTKDLCGYYKGIEDEKMKLIKRIVDATGAKIVLTSTWKEHWHKEKTLKKSQDDSANYIDSKFQNASLSICDKTEDDGFNRGDGIIEYLRHLRWKGIEVSNYVIIDDEIFDYKERKLTKNLVQTSYYSGGLKEKHVENAIKILGDKV